MKTQRFLTVLVALAIALAYTSCKDEEGKNSSGDSFTSDNKEVNIDVSVTPNVPTGELVFAKITDFSKFDQTLVSGTTEGLKRTLVLKKESGTLKCGVVIGDELRIPPSYVGISAPDIVPNYVIVQKEINGVIYDGLCSVITGKETIPCKYTGGMRFEMDTIEGKVFPSGIVYAFDGDRKSKVTKEGDQHWFYFNGIELNYPDKENIEIYKDGSKQGIKIKGERKPRIKADTYDELIPVTGTKYYYRETKTSYSLMTHFIARIGDKYGLVHYTGAVIIPVTYAGYDPLDDGRTQLTAVYLWSPFKGANASQKKALDCNGDPYKMTKRTSEERQKYYDEENRKEIEKNREDYQRRLNSGK